MKQIITTIAIALMTAMSAMAQTDSLSEAYSRIKTLEDKVQQQNTQISKLSSDVNEVLKQNLALKKNLNLQPTIATAKSGDLEYRIVELTGDPIKNRVQGVIMAENTGLKENLVTYEIPIIIDENGAKYNKFDSFEAQFKESQGSLVRSITSYPVKVPMQIVFTINGVGPDTKYIKYFELVQRVGDNAEFQNLPIKWTEQ